MQSSTITTAAGTKTRLDEIGGLLVTSLEDAYNAIRRDHPEIPPAVILISSRPPTKTRQIWGHFASSRWDVQGHKLSEIMVAAEGLKRPAREVLATVVHEGAHGLCMVRGIKDTSDSGRYHNEDFKRVAEELGLTVKRSSHPKDRGGWTLTTLPEGNYDNLVKELTLDLIAYRESEVSFSQVGGDSKRTIEESFRCSCPRKIRAYERAYNAGPILCGVCGDEFL